MRHDTHSVSLLVKPADEDETYRDFARINIADRGKITKGGICLISVGDKRAHVILRGNKRAGEITLDSAMRHRLGVKKEATTKFKIQQCGFFGELRWALSATDPAYRIAAKLGVLSFLLGILSLVFGLLAIPEWFWQMLGKLI
jgi:hypothetical protein